MSGDPKMIKFICGICGDDFLSLSFGYEHLLDHEIRELFRLTDAEYEHAMAQINLAMADLRQNEAAAKEGPGF